MLDDDDIIASVKDLPDSDSSDAEDDIPVKKEKLSTIQCCVDTLLDYTIYSKVPEAI